ncbi:hypothetical protein CKO23_16615 [Thiocystis violacea]|nr:hypothetical protein [Thiocystis violacea]
MRCTVLAVRSVSQQPAVAVLGFSIEHRTGWAPEEVILSANSCMAWRRQQTRLRRQRQRVDTISCIREFKPIEKITL